jgi:lysophospholipase L1-like esterase
MAGILSGQTVAPVRTRRNIFSRVGGPFAGQTGATSNTANGGGNATKVYEVSRFFACDDATDLSLLYANIGNSQASGLGFQPFTVKASIVTAASAVEYPTVTGVFPVFWRNGSRISPAIEPGAYLESEPVSVRVARGDLIGVRRLLSFTAAPTHWPTSEVGLYAGDEVRNLGTTVTDGTDGGDFPGGFYSRDGSTPLALSAPFAILGTGTGRPSVAIIADSITGIGSGDSGAVPHQGWAKRSLYAGGYGALSIGNEGYALNTLMATSNAGRQVRALRLRALRAAGVTHALMTLGSNDIFNGRTKAAFLADLTSFIAEAKLAGVAVIVCTCPPRTNAGNTAPSNTGQAAIAVDLNSTLLTDSTLTVLDIGGLMRGGNASSYLWGSQGTADGVHPSQAMHEYLAGQVGPLLDRLLG